MLNLRLSFTSVNFDMLILAIHQSPLRGQRAGEKAIVAYYLLCRIIHFYLPSSTGLNSSTTEPRFANRSKPAIDDTSVSFDGIVLIVLLVTELITFFFNNMVNKMAFGNKQDSRETMERSTRSYCDLQALA